LNDIFYASTVTGVIGGILVNGLTYLCLLIGIPSSTPWQIGADIFLDPPLINTPAGLILGVIVSFALSFGTAFVICLALQATSRKFAPLKGIIISNALNFINLGLILPLLNVWPQIHHEPATYFVAMVVLTIQGTVLGYLLRTVV
jgi:hypothetical protein